MSEELKAKLLRIAAKVARREYLPSLERCRTIQDARIEVARFDDFHAQLAQALKAIFDQAGRESLSAPADQFGPDYVLKTIGGILVKHQVSKDDMLRVEDILMTLLYESYPADTSAMVIERASTRNFPTVESAPPKPTTTEDANA